MIIISTYENVGQPRLCWGEKEEREKKDIFVPSHLLHKGRKREREREGLNEVKTRNNSQFRCRETETERHAEPL